MRVDSRWVPAQANINVDEDADAQHMLLNEIFLGDRLSLAKLF